MTKTKATKKILEEYGNRCGYCDTEIEEGDKVIVEYDQFYCSEDCLNEEAFILKNF